MKTTLELNKLCFDYGRQPILNDVSLQLDAGQIGTLLGPSGCGKSTLLRLIAGFSAPKSGSIKIGDSLVADSQKITAPQDRKVGMMFQDLALFPHLDVSKNIAFGLSHLSQEQQQHRIDQLLTLCRLQGYESRYPHQLSGGQRQRVALARAMAPKPKLMLLDEPFSSVDTGLQSDLAQEVKAMLQADQSTALWVTHSVSEAFAVADQIGVMLAGQLLQWSSPEQLHDKPQHPAVIHFMNHSSLITGQLTTNGTLISPLGTHHIDNHSQFKPGQSVQIAVLHQDLKLDAATTSHSTQNTRIQSCIYQGGHYHVTAQLNTNETVRFFHPRHIEHDTNITLKLDGDKVYSGFIAER